MDAVLVFVVGIGIVVEDDCNAGAVVSDDIVAVDAVALYCNDKAGLDPVELAYFLGTDYIAELDMEDLKTAKHSNCL